MMYFVTFSRNFGWVKIWKSVEVKVAYESLLDFKGIFKADSRLSSLAEFQNILDDMAKSYEYDYQVTLSIQASKAKRKFKIH